MTNDPKTPEANPSPLPPITACITGYNPQTGQSIIERDTLTEMQPVPDQGMAFNVVYTNSMRPNLANDADLAAHDATVASDKLGVVAPNGTVCRVVDLAPGSSCVMHRTRSLDIGVIMEGSIEMVLDSGEKKVLGRGDIVVQRATMHAWANTSQTEWVRMMFILQDVEPFKVAGKEVVEELGTAAEFVKSSGN
ncbi:cupin domain-containing protein [Aspergillus candidus]|uniref:Cupin type-2 domain-containing protein n=1 Tax=Aspergillus candidus TaxID=41067 RepID=A0A2I2FK36_ASPCN|nr:hypothetical protein BDW47DRAFT_100309 [Aspergillus candidus]PLB40991.1 hypothetical protein BDW47DRAFT_100309 [Aspergillus candidus]